MKYDIYQMLEYVNYEIKENKAKKFVPIAFYERLCKKHTLPEGLPAGLKKPYPDRNGSNVRSTILLNTASEVLELRKAFSIPRSVEPRTVLEAEYGPSRATNTIQPERVVAPAFIQPYPQQDLGGELGLTSSDLALSLGVQLKHVHEKVRRIDIEDWLFDGFRVETTATAKRGTTYTFNVVAAKYFIGGWNNVVGRGYFRYLLECEKVAEKVMEPKALYSSSEMANIIAMATSIMAKMIPEQVTTITKTFTPRIEMNTIRHDDAMLSASQQAICQPLFSEANLKHQCSIIHALIKKAAKAKFRPDAPSSDCTWHKIRQSDFEALVTFIQTYELSELDLKRIAKFYTTDAGKKDLKKWKNL